MTYKLGAIDNEKIKRKNFAKYNICVIMYLYFYFLSI